MLLASPDQDLYHSKDGHKVLQDQSIITMFRVTYEADFTLEHWRILSGTTVNNGVQQWNIFHDKTRRNKWSEVEGWITQKIRNKITRSKNGNRGGGG